MVILFQKMMNFLVNIFQITMIGLNLLQTFLALMDLL